ncbi:class I SAM-dependent methyltransferase [Luteolibacter sp. GHJ8]|uniref:Class I SAM-dependent methyltransferase n=1 Tax=Luteolibacter rhizosphaerae TaxID=2989719 RepID=A0ABT3G0I6_9BACT|nr:class I SAM-dependent methyltransferase [Luteolibacter rhizosphaerae]MCW1913348.1 class I SAM-dependent methyltransferase [Luteolibacter rhizosphaerae]
MSELTAPSWLLRIPEVFAPFAKEILAGLSASPLKELGSDYHLVRLENPALLQESEWAKFVGWNLPVHHAWPCNPQKMDGFIEKAAQGLARKFADVSPQTLLTGPLQTAVAHPYYKHLATNLRGRALQLFPPLPAVAEVESQDPAAPTLFCLLGKEGLFAGLQSPRLANGFYPGGTKFISQSAGISRAGAKLAEALHHLLLHRQPPPQGARWLELGASPGGMTSELLARGYQVTAVDRADLDASLKRKPGLEFIRRDVDAFRPEPRDRFDALLCDMNGDPRVALRQVLRLAANVQTGGLIIFTLKGAGAETASELNAISRACVSYAGTAGVELLSETHLTYNRHEFTLFFEVTR